MDGEEIGKPHATRNRQNVGAEPTGEELITVTRSNRSFCGVTPNSCRCVASEYQV